MEKFGKEIKPRNNSDMDNEIRNRNVHEQNVPEVVKATYIVQHDLGSESKMRSSNSTIVDQPEEHTDSTGDKDGRAFDSGFNQSSQDRNVSNVSGASLQTTPVLVPTATVVSPKVIYNLACLILPR